MLAVSGFAAAGPAHASGTVTLTASQPFYVAGSAPVFTATSSQDVEQFGDYALAIRDDTNGKVIAACTGSWSTCTMEYFNVADGVPDVFRAYVGVVDGDTITDVQAVSSPLPMDWKPFAVSLTVQQATEGVNVVAVANQNVAYSGVDIEIYDVTADEYVATCSGGRGCRRFFYQSEDYVTHTFHAHIQRRGEFVLASTDPSALTVFGPTIANAQGGNTMSQECVQRCQGDPVNTATGVFWDQATDLQVAGRGPAFAWKRNYSAAMNALDGPLGYGWTHNYAMKTTTDPVSGAVTVTQENGSQVTFTPDGAAGFTSTADIRADLTADSSGGVTFIRRQGQTAFAFNSAGLLTSVTDRNGEATALTYSGGKLDSITDPAGRVATVTWTGTRITSVTDSANRTIGYGYTGSGDLSTFTDVRGKQTTYTYAAHRMITKTDPRGGVLTNAYDGSGRITSQVDPMGETATFDYSTNGAVDFTDYTNERGVTNRSVYASGVLIEQIDAYGTSDASSQKFYYDPDTFALVQVTDEREQNTYFQVDNRGNRLSETNPADATKSWTYNSDDDVVTQTNELDVTTTLTRDSNGNVTSISTPVNATTSQTTTHAYTDSAHPGDVTATTDPRGKTTTFERNANGDIITVTDPLGQVTSHGYDSISRLTSTVSPRGNLPGATAANFTTSTTRNPAGQVLTVTDPNGAVTSMTYDDSGNPITITDPNGKTSTTTYDALNRPTQTTRPDLTVIKTGYDKTGNVTSQTDANNKVTLYTYNRRNQVLTVTDPLGRTRSNVYDGIGRIIERKDGLNKRTEIQYDGANRVTAILYDAFHSSTTPNLYYTYDKAGNRTQTDDGLTRTEYTYDALNRLVTADTADDAGDRNYQYNLNNQVTRLTYPNGQYVERGYDDAGQWTSATDWSAQTFTFGYNPDGALTSRFNPNGTTESRTYDNGGRPTLISHSTATPTSIASFAYTYDAASQVTGWTPTGTADTPRTNTYTDNGRLASVNTAAYTWDSADNLTGQPTQTLTYDVANQPATRTLGSTITTLTHNANGNRTKEAVGATTTRTFVYDAENRLTSHVKAGVTTTYKNDADGLRGSKKIGSAAAKRFIWDTQAPLPMLLTDSTSMYLWGPGNTLLEQKPLATGNPAYPHTDALGTIHALTGPTGTVVGTSVYNTHGAKTSSTGTVTSPFGYAGEYFDTESGLINLRARYYDPATGTFLTRDPLVSQTRDPYGYASGDPIGKVDPTGMLGLPFVDTGISVKTTLKVVAYGGAAVAVGAALVAAAPTVLVATPIAAAAGSLAFGASAASTTAGLMLAVQDCVPKYRSFDCAVSSAGAIIPPVGGLVARVGAGKLIGAVVESGLTIGLGGVSEAKGLRDKSKAAGPC